MTIHGITYRSFHVNQSYQREKISWNHENSLCFATKEPISQRLQNMRNRYTADAQELNTNKHYRSSAKCTTGCRSSGEKHYRLQLRRKALQTAGPHGENNYRLQELRRKALYIAEAHGEKQYRLQQLRRKALQTAGAQEKITTDCRSS